MIEPSPSDSKIRRLSSHVVDCIAAGEVVERPASVVKELVENALDAGANRLEVRLEGGGLRRILVRDNGSGMSDEDARLCLERHATSKLRTVDDLSRIETLGFRGEAISSIAAVSRLQLTTRRAEDDAALRLEVEAGGVEDARPVGAPVGTTFDVRDLFFNTPARSKFMRSPATEQSHASDAALRGVMGARRPVGLVVSSGDRRLLELSEHAAPEERARTALGRGVRSLRAIDAALPGLRLTGYISEPDESRGDTRGIWLFINGRFVRDRMLQRAVLDAYSGVLPARSYPFAVLYLDVDPRAVDVNVHPQKLEVRFANQHAVFRGVNNAIVENLADSSSQQTLTEAWSGRVQRATERFFETEASHADVQAAYQKARLGASPASRAPGFSNPPPAPELPLPPTEVSYLGRVGDRFLLCEQGDALLVVDLHRAGARRAREALRRQLAGEIDARTALLLPEVFNAPAEAEAFFATPWVARTGFAVDPVGPGRFALREVPQSLQHCRPSVVAQRLAAAAKNAAPEDPKWQAQWVEGWAQEAVLKVEVHDAALAPLIRQLRQEDEKSDDAPVVRHLHADDLAALFGGPRPGAS